MWWAILSGLLTGWAIAVPVGAVGALLVSLTARTSPRVGAAGALGVATVDGVYAAVAVVGGTALASAIAPIAGPLRVASGVVLLGLAAWTIRQSLTAATRPVEAKPMSAGAAYWAFVGITAVNPATVAYFALVVLGNRGILTGPAEAAAFVAAAFAASASWQLTLVAGGSVLGRLVTGPRGRLVTGVVSGVVIAALAVWTLVR